MRCNNKGLSGEEPMRLKVVAAAFAVSAAIGMMAAPADAAPKKKVAVLDARGQTVFTSRDEEGKTRTRIIIQKRSFLDPGTEVLPGDTNDRHYAFSPNHSGLSVFDNTAFGRSQSTLPGPFDMSGKNNPWLRF
jgi:hypothetical protein